MDVSATVTALTGELTQQSTPERAEGEKRYLKSDLEFLGATVPTIRQTAKRFRRWTDLSMRPLPVLRRVPMFWPMLLTGSLTSCYWRQAAKCFCAWKRMNS